jgi:hypothetical protein
MMQAPERCGMTRKLSLKDLIERLDTPGWHLASEHDDNPDTGTLSDVLKTAHRRKNAAGFIKQIETSVELDMIQVQQLWQHLGLPML